MGAVIYRSEDDHRFTKGGIVPFTLKGGGFRFLPLSSAPHYRPEYRGYSNYHHILIVPPGSTLSDAPQLLGELRCKKCNTVNGLVRSDGVLEVAADYKAIQATKQGAIGPTGLCFQTCKCRRVNYITPNGEWRMDNGMPWTSEYWTLEQAAQFRNIHPAEARRNISMIGLPPLRDGETGAFLFWRNGIGAEPTALAEMSEREAEDTSRT